MENVVRTLRAIGPLAWRALMTGQLLRPQCQLVTPDPDVLARYDVPVPLPEGPDWGDPSEGF